MKKCLYFIGLLIWAFLQTTIVKANEYQPVLFIASENKLATQGEKSTLEVVFNSLGNDIASINLELLLNGAYDAETITHTDVVTDRKLLVSPGMELTDYQQLTNDSNDTTITALFEAKGEQGYDEGSAAVPILTVTFTVLEGTNIDAFIGDNTQVTKVDGTISNVDIYTSKTTPFSLTLQPQPTISSSIIPSPKSTPQPKNYSNKINTAQETLNPKQDLSNTNVSMEATSASQLLENQEETSLEPQINKQSDPITKTIFRSEQKLPEKQPIELPQVIKSFFSKVKKLFTFNRIDIIGNN